MIDRKTLVEKIEAMEDAVRIKLLELIELRWELLRYHPKHRENSLAKWTGRKELSRLTLDEAYSYYLYLRDVAQAEPLKKENNISSSINDELEDVKW